MGKIADEIINTIDYIVQKRMEKFLTCDYVATVISSSDKFCTVMINGAEYKVKNGTVTTFNPGDSCLVHCINFNFQNKIIIAKLNSSNSGASGVVTSVNGYTGTVNLNSDYYKKSEIDNKLSNLDTSDVETMTNADIDALFNN